MYNTFITSFKLRSAYRTNSIIYAIREFPLVKKLLSTSLYKDKSLKTFGNVVSIILEICSIFLGKLLYIWLCIFSLLSLFEVNTSDSFLHIFVFLTLAGGLLNTYMFNPTKDKYYAIIIMRMEAREFALANYCYAMLKTLLGFMPFTIMFGLVTNVPLIICLTMPIFVVMVKITSSAYVLLKYKRTGYATNENKITKGYWIIIGFLLTLAYGLPYIDFTINTVVYWLCLVVSLILGACSIKVISQFKLYKSMYRQLLIPDNVYIADKQLTNKAVKDKVVGQIEHDINFTSNKTGYARFHDLFVKRHNKILLRAVKRQTIFIGLIIVVASIIVLINSEAATTLNSILLVYLPYFVFIMYSLNRGTTLTQALFMNCDHSMLTYRVYRTPKVILGVFKERLKTLIYINMFPALLIGSGLTFLLFISGGTTQPLNYAVTFISIPCMSIFFSVHYLVMYYLLQPYNISTEIKSSTYVVVQSITYFVCYWMIGFKFPTLYFGIIIIMVSILYSLISLYLVYKHAPKTFRIRM